MNKSMSSIVLGLSLAIVLILTIILVGILYPEHEANETTQYSASEEEQDAAAVTEEPEQPVQQEEQQESEEITEEQAIKEKEKPQEVNYTLDPEDFEIEIVFSKDIYKEKADVEGHYMIRYKNLPFDVIIIKGESRKGVDRTRFSLTKAILGHPDKTHELKLELKAFRIEDNYYSSGRPYFDDEGVYAYYIAVYGCETIADLLGKTCEEIGIEDAETIADIEPVVSKIKTIIVTEI